MSQSDAELPILRHWFGVDLEQVAQQGEQLLRASDGRTVALLSRHAHHVPGDLVVLEGVSRRLQLCGLVGLAIGGDFEVWTAFPTWSSTARAERPR